MAFLKNLFGRGGQSKVLQDSVPPSQDDFDNAYEQLKTAVAVSPHKATLDIANMATAVFELYSNLADSQEQQGDRNAFVFTVVQGVSMATMAAEASYNIGCAQQAIEALKLGLGYAQKAVSFSPQSPHRVQINEERETMTRLLKAYEAAQRQAEQTCLEICTNIQDAGVDFTNDGDPIWTTKGLQTYVRALSEAISELVYCIIVPGHFAPYRDIWRQDPDVFRELASFLGYFLAIHTLPNETEAQRKRCGAALPVIATGWEPTERVHAIIERYHALISDPQEMKDRRILSAHPSASDDQARAVVYAFIVNEIINGPDLGLEREDPRRLNPMDSFYLRSYLQDALIPRIESLRAVAARF